MFLRSSRMVFAPYQLKFSRNTLERLKLGDLSRCSKLPLAVFEFFNFRNNCVYFITSIKFSFLFHVRLQMVPTYYYYSV